MSADNQATIDPAKFPDVHKYELPLEGDKVATLLYSDRAAKKIGEGNLAKGKNLIKTAFTSAVDKPNLAVLVESSDINPEYLEKNFGQDIAKSPEIYLQQLFNPHIKSIVDKHPEYCVYEDDPNNFVSYTPYNASTKYWRDMVDGMKSQQTGFHGENTLSGFTLIYTNIEKYNQSTGYGRDHTLNALGLLGHEFDHLDQGDYDEGLNPHVALLMGEGKSDNARFDSAKTSDKFTKKFTESVLFHRSRDAIFNAITEDIDTAQSGANKFGNGLYQFNHATSIIVNEKGRLIENIDNKVLEKAILDLRDKISKTILPTIQEALLEHTINDLNALTIKASDFRKLNIDTLSVVISEINDFSNKHDISYISDFIKNSQSHIDDIIEVHRNIKLKTISLQNDSLKLYDKTPIEAEKHLKKYNQSTEHPQLTKAYEDLRISTHALQTEARIMFSVVKERNPELFKTFLVKSDATKIIFGHPYRSYDYKTQFNAVLHNELSDMKQRGAFAGDPLQMRFIDAFLKGSDLDPTLFDQDMLRYEFSLVPREVPSTMVKQAPTVPQTSFSTTGTM